MINFIFGFVVGGAIVYFFMLMMKKPGLQAKEDVPSGGIYQNEDEAKKQSNMAKVEEFIADKDQFTNDDLQTLLGVSNTTVGRYLQELESARKITQHGDIGAGVRYTEK